MTTERRIGGQYCIVEKLGEGGMGEVFKGFDTMLEREVAIKSLRSELSSRADIVERFRTEAVALGRLNNPHIAMLYSFLQDEGQYYMVMEFVRGETLNQVIMKRNALPWQESVKLVIQALDGLEHAHRLGVVHRDIKPANMMLTHGNQLKLMDFGIARLLERARLTRTGHLIGTLEYISPEQAKGLETDARTDIYSLGIVLFEMLTGHVPFQKGSDYDLIKSQVEELPPSFHAHMPHVPLELERIAFKALEKRPDDRFPSAAAFQAELQRLLIHENSGNFQDEPPETRYEVHAPYDDTTANYRLPLDQVHATGSKSKLNARKPGNVISSIRSVWINYPGPVLLLVLSVGAASLVINGPHSSEPKSQLSTTNVIGDVQSGTSKHHQGIMPPVQQRPSGAIPSSPPLTASAPPATPHPPPIPTNIIGPTPSFIPLPERIYDSSDNIPELPTEQPKASVNEPKVTHKKRNRSAITTEHVNVVNTNKEDRSGNTEKWVIIPGQTQKTR